MAHKRRGFTLIEILVTVSIFTAVLAVLAQGLHSGVRTWRTVKLHQSRDAKYQQAAKKFADDFRHLMIFPDRAPVMEAEKEDGGEKISVAVAGQRNNQRAKLDWVWKTVDYEVIDKGDGQKNLCRTTMHYAGSSPVGGEPEEEVLLENVQSVRFDYFGQEGPVSVWAGADTAPYLVLMTVTPQTGRERVMPAPVPAGALKRRRLAS